MGIGRIDPYFREAIDSILAQSFRDFEFLIIIDLAIRELEDEIRKLYPREDRIRMLLSAPLGGLAYKLNIGVGEARGEYIARMDADDISRPDRLLEQVRYMDENKDMAVLGCRVQMMDSNSARIERQYPFYESDLEIRRMLPLRNPMVHPALMFRRSALYSVHGYKYGNTAEDYEMFLRMARNPELKFHNLDKILFDYRRHALQVTGLSRVKINYQEKAGFLFTEFLRTHSLKYLVGILLMHPFVYRTRTFFRKRVIGIDL
jgi:glycosyltransferase involved in cell wall biosynthesis